MDMDETTSQAHAEASQRLARLRGRPLDPGGRPRGTHGQPAPVAQLTLDELEARAKTIAASEAAIEAFNRRTREAAEQEMRERFGEAVKTANRIVPLPPHHRTMVISHARPWRDANQPVLKGTSSVIGVARWFRPKNEHRTVLALLGNMGTGKTTAAYLAAVRVAMAGGSVMYIKEPTLVRLKRYVSKGDMLEQAMSCGLLIIDELGTERKSADEASAAVLEIVDDRLGRGRTMIIGNMSAVTFGEKYDARLHDRMREVGIVVECREDSMRGGAR